MLKPTHFSDEAYDLVVVGGGAAGVFGAICSAQILAGAQAVRILVVEKSDHLLAKVRISGGGRCNLTAACFDVSELRKNYPHGAKELLGPFNRFQPRDTMQWFESHCVELKVEADGRVFPTSNRSQTIIDCLILESQKLGIEFRLKHGVNQIDVLESPPKTFIIHFSNGTSVSTRNILLAPGGGSTSAYELARKLGHNIIPPVPSLFTFEIHDPRLQDLSGISVQETYLSLLELPQPDSRKDHHGFRGPVLITHRGLSGPAVLKLSAWAARPMAECHYTTPLVINWLADHTRDSFFELLKAYRANMPRKLIYNANPCKEIPQRLWRSIIDSALTKHASRTSISLEWQNASNQVLRALAEEVTNCNFSIQGRNTNKDEFVTSGGVDLREIDFRLMQSKIIPGIFFAGEFLDIDGLTGGYNFQAAWTTSWLAGNAIADRIKNG